jgi:hypothetical protein
MVIFGRSMRRRAVHNSNHTSSGSRGIHENQTSECVGVDPYQFLVSPFGDRHRWCGDSPLIEEMDRTFPPESQADPSGLCAGQVPFVGAGRGVPHPAVGGHGPASAVPLAERPVHRGQLHRSTGGRHLPPDRQADAAASIRLLEALQAIAVATSGPEQRKVIRRHAEMIHHGVQKALTEETDRDDLEKRFREVMEKPGESRS